MDSVTPHLDFPIFLQQLYYISIYGPSQTRRFVEGLRSKTLKLLEYGYWDYFSELHDEPAGRTVTVTTDRRGLRNPTLSQTSPSSFSSCTTLPPTDHHRHDGPSRFFVPKHLNSWNMGAGITSLNIMTNLQDRPSQTRRTVVDSVTPHLVRLLHPPLAAALCCSSLKISCHVVMY